MLKKLAYIFLTLIPGPAFTNEPKETAMEIYNFCNLEWDEKCLDFYKRDDLGFKVLGGGWIKS